MKLIPRDDNSRSGQEELTRFWDVRGLPIFTVDDIKLLCLEELLVDTLVQLVDEEDIVNDRHDLPQQTHRAFFQHAETPNEPTDWQQETSKNIENNDH